MGGGGGVCTTFVCSDLTLVLVIVLSQHQYSHELASECPVLTCTLLALVCMVGNVCYQKFMHGFVSKKD